MTALRISALLLFACCLVASGDDGSIVRNRGPFQVDFGKRTFLQRSDLRIRASDATDCKVEARRSEGSSVGGCIGSLYPPAFPCNYRTGDVYYDHFGLPTFNSTTLTFLVTYYNERNEFMVDSFSMTIEVKAPATSIVSRNPGLNVELYNWYSDPISASNLGFDYDKSTHDCKVSVLAGCWPRYGNVVNDTLSTLDVDCDRFLSSRIMYRNTEYISPQTDYVQGHVTITDEASGEVTAREWFAIRVFIRPGAANKPPTFSETALLQLEVPQFILTALTPRVLGADDDTTPAGDLVFSVPPDSAPSLGSIVSTDDQTLPITSFTQSDVHLLKIAYKPPTNASDADRLDRVPLAVYDGHGTRSLHAYELVVTIKSKDTLAPIVTLNKGLKLLEGEQSRIISSQHLMIADEDNVDDVKVTVQHGLLHGRLSIPDSRSYFTVSDLRAGSVTYEHDDTDTLTDNIIFKVSDGRNEIEFLFPITIIPVDDSSPVLQVNTGLRLYEGMTYQITNLLLRAADADSDDSLIRYTLEQPYSEVGEFVLRRRDPEDQRGWTNQGAYWEKRVTDWTQSDIDQGYLYYRQASGNSTAASGRDRVRFKLSDSKSPPNISPTETFIIRILERDSSPPVQSADASFLLIVPEGKTTPLTRDVLSFTDDITKNRDISYAIKSISPTEDDREVGKFVYTDTPEYPVEKFSQGEVNRGKISYQPADGEIGIVPRMIDVVFDVHDSSGNVVTGQKLTVFVQPVNNKPPVVRTSPLSVFQHGYVILTPSNLQATDADTNDESITFTVEKPPQFGQLKLQGNEVVQGSKFTKKDISNGGVVYTSSGADSLADSLVIDVSDGVHHIPAVLRVNIQPVDGGFPTYDAGDSLTFNLRVHEGKLAYLNASMLPQQGVSADVQFTVSGSPLRGLVSQEVFTLSDMQQGLVYYYDTQGEIGPEPLTDAFNLTVSQGQILVNSKYTPNVYVQVTILPVDNNAPVITTGSDFYVDEGGVSVITPSHLSIVDVDSLPDNVLCTIQTQPEYGFLELSSPAYGSEFSRSGQPISAFSLLDLNQGHLSYRQSIHEGIEPAADAFTIVCSDGLNVDNRGLRFSITIVPANDEMPRIYVNDFVVEEGKLLQIDLPILNVIDRDLPPNLLDFKVLKQPVNGRLLKSTANRAVDVEEFSFDDIRFMSKIAYLHDDTETTNDSLTLQVSDGEHTAIKEISIRILPVDDEVPQILVNTGLYIEAEVETPEWKYITDKELKAEDIDSPNGNITYKIRQQPVFGFLQRLVGGGDTSWDNITRHMTFQQWELDQSIIRYVHNGRYGVRDVIKLDISDWHKNSQIDRRFYITVEPLDMIYPDVVNRGVELPESQSVILTTDMLSAWDDKSSAESIVFTLTSMPKYGHLESTDSPGRPITSFSQVDLAAGRIRYVHNSGDSASSDGFEFEVTDGFNPLHRAFSISILPVDNELPVLMIQSIRLREKGTTYITPNQLLARDRDTSTDALTYTIMQAPLFGEIKLSGATTSRFTQLDLENGFVTYEHTGPESPDGKPTEDSFKIKVSDGTHRKFLVYPDLDSPTSRAQTVTVQIAAVDDSVPELLVNNPVTSLRREADGPRLSHTLTSANLKVKDRDTPDNLIIYWLIDRPQNGQVLKGGTPVSMWTQADIDNQMVKYVLNEGAKETSDHFSFRVQDGGGNDIPSTVFTLNWSYVSFKFATLEVNETDGQANVLVQRRGSLRNTAFVSMRIRDVTTTAGADYRRDYARQIQFNPGEFEKSWSLQLVDDTAFEVKEMLTLELHDPIDTTLESHEWATVTINNPEDEPTISLSSADPVFIQESVGRAAITIKRTGDLDSEVIAVCGFKEGMTKGTAHPALYTDFILRSSAVRFVPGQSEANCYVDIVDDSYIEPAEDFKVFIERVEGGLIGQPNSTTVTILEDNRDLPVIRFQSSYYQAVEGQGTLNVEVERKGGDLSKPSEVMVISTRAPNGQQAEPMEDYMPVSHSLTFNPDDTMKALRVTILDDRSMPMVEGQESFSLQLRFPDQAVLGQPNATLITIQDETDVPDFAFSELSYTVSELNSTLPVSVRRYGDVSREQKISCVTEPRTAREGHDFAPRRADAAVSEVVFAAGAREVTCTINILDDNIYEGDETFLVRIVTDGGETNPKPATVTITDEEDKPMLGFTEPHVYVSEPSSADQYTTARLTVRRSGDTSQVSIVTVYAIEGSAKSGLDYIDGSSELEFGAGVKERVFDVKILYDGEPELRESFSVMLSSDSRGVASLATSRVSVYITDENSVTGLVFPVDPIVVSLKDFDSPGSATEPPNGYPLVCITPCDERHPQYSRTKVICDTEGIDNSLTQYRWKVGQPIGRDGLAFDLQTVTSDTFITSTASQTLDSIYFRPGSRVQCLATASSDADYRGLERGSGVVTVSATEGVCRPQRIGYSGGQPYLSKIKYLGSDHKKYPNHIKLSVFIPHRDGMLPAISTEKLSNFDYMLSPSATRIGLHRCSNLVKTADSSLNVGWRDGRKADEAFLPYQHDRDLRGADAVKFYSNLDLSSCMWEFDAMFKLSELINVCNAQVETNSQIEDLTKSYVSLVIPLYVSYAFHSMSAPGGWQHYDLSSQQRVTFVYDTALLVRQGISNVQADGTPVNSLSGRLYLQSMKIQPQGNLLVKFQTQPNFRGKFLLKSDSAQSSIRSADRDDLRFSLELISAEQTFANPRQLWQFRSDSAIRDYSGKYLVTLLPCVAADTTAYATDAPCAAARPLVFQLDLELRQVSDPVAEVFSLNTELTLSRSKRAWLSNNRTGSDLSDVEFQAGEKIYGRIDTRQLQDTENPHDVLVDKVFVCAGKDGFVPKYSPDAEEYGCAADSGSLHAQYKILDKSSPDLVTKQLNGVPFNARFASEHGTGRRLYDLPGVDGFVFDSKPLNSDSERQWFVHVIYSVDTLTDPLKIMRRYRRAQVSDISGVGVDKGTNMAFVYIEEPQEAAPVGPVKQPNSYVWIISLGLVCVLLLLVVAGIAVVTRKIQQQRKSLRNRKQAEDRRPGPEQTPMPVDEEECGAVRLDATVSTSEI